MGFIKNAINRIKKEKDPVKYWRSKGAKIGKNTEIYPSANLGSEPYLISIGDNVRISHNVCLFNHDGGVWVLRNLKEEYKNADLFGKIKIGSNVHIGINATIMPNVTIGDNCIIGCGSIVTHDIPSNSIAAGVPARVIESILDYERKHHSSYENTKGFTKEEKRRYLTNKYESGERFS